MGRNLFGIKSTPPVGMDEDNGVDDSSISESNLKLELLGTLIKSESTVEARDPFDIVTRAASRRVQSHLAAEVGERVRLVLARRDREDLELFRRKEDRALLLTAGLTW
ncbi:MAG: hypothetical protein IH808_08530 [Proteobacteria bacterium]|nr:hypothetical protein [Pseudomonadota bacterium]